jgi:hypothetical protein
MKKDAEAEKWFGEPRVTTLEDTVTHQRARITALEKQLADARQQAKTCGAMALAHINQIAMEQAKNGPQGRSDDDGSPGENFRTIGRRFCAPAAPQT